MTAGSKSWNFTNTNFGELANGVVGLQPLVVLCPHLNSGEIKAWLNGTYYLFAFVVRLLSLA